MFFKRFKVLFRGIALAFVSGVAFGNSSADVFYYRFPEVGSNKVLVSDFAGMQFDGNVAFKTLLAEVEEFNRLFGGNFA